MKEKIKYIIAMVLTSSVFIGMGTSTKEPINNKQDSNIIINESLNNDINKDNNKNYNPNKYEEDNEKLNSGA